MLTCDMLASQCPTWDHLAPPIINANVNSDRYPNSIDEKWVVHHYPNKGSCVQRQRENSNDEGHIIPSSQRIKIVSACLEESLRAIVELVGRADDVQTILRLALDSLIKCDDEIKDCMRRPAAITKSGDWPTNGQKCRLMNLFASHLTVVFFSLAEYLLSHENTIDAMAHMLSPCTGSRRRGKHLVNSVRAFDTNWRRIKKMVAVDLEPSMWMPVAQARCYLSLALARLSLSPTPCVSAHRTVSEIVLANLLRPFFDFDADQIYLAEYRLTEAKLMQDWVWFRGKTSISIRGWCTDFDPMYSWLKEAIKDRERFDEDRFAVSQGLRGHKSWLPIRWNYQAAIWDVQYNFGSGKEVKMCAWPRRRIII